MENMSEEELDLLVKEKADKLRSMFLKIAEERGHEIEEYPGVLSERLLHIWTTME